MATRRTDARDLIDGLNEDLANEYASVIQYRTFASTLRGPHRLTLVGHDAPRTQPQGD